jgi:hypothetical protein
MTASGSLVLENNFKRPHPIFYIYVIMSPLKRFWQFHLKQLNLPLPKDDLYQFWLNLAD